MLKPCWRHNILLPNDASCPVVRYHVRWAYILARCFRFFELVFFWAEVCYVSTENIHSQVSMARWRSLSSSRFSKHVSTSTLPMMSMIGRPGWSWCVMTKWNFKKKVWLYNWIVSWYHSESMDVLQCHMYFVPGPRCRHPMCLSDKVVKIWTH